MTEPTLSAQLRESQHQLSLINDRLASSLALAYKIGLAPFRIAGIQHAIHYNQTAWDDLNTVATSLELTGADHKL